MKKFKLLFAVLLLPLFLFGQVKKEKDVLKAVEDAKVEAIKQKGLAEDAVKRGDCAAARTAAAAALNAANDADAAAYAVAFAEASATASSSYAATASDAADAAAAAAAAARTAANGCIPKPQQPDYLKQAQDARDEAIRQKDLAEAAFNRGDCETVIAAAEAALAAANNANNAARDNKNPSNTQAINLAARAAGEAYNLAAAASLGCKPKTQTPPAPAKAPGGLSATPTVGGGVGAAQSSADVGYCWHNDEWEEAPKNSTPVFFTDFGLILSKKNTGGAPSTTSLDRPLSPYASFASYRPSAPAPVRPPVQGGSLDLMSLNLGVSYLHLKGDDRHPERGASFDKKMVEVLATGDFYFVNLLRAKRATSSPKVSPFVRLGAGFGIGNPNTVNGDKGDKKANFALPMGLGLRVRVTDLMSINLDYTTRATFSDALDGITGPTNNKDWYGSGGLGLNFLLGKKANDSDGDGVKNNDDPCPNVAGTIGGCPDSDGDGLADREDLCPNEAGEQRLGGCPDTDGDGIVDNMDDCPEDAGLRRFSGCPDTDGDNIIDKEDKCPTVAGLAPVNGCPDADRDGIIDEKDDCPDLPGTGELNGCPDTDNDGIVDSKDECPYKTGPAKFNGCPDSDGDGLADPKDKCPNLTGPTSNEGCPEIEKADKTVLDRAMRSVQFRTGSAELLPSSRKDLDQIAEIMSRYKGYLLTIDGYTDNAGLESVNQSLSESRAKACYDYLGSIGVKLSQMKYVGHGSTSPIGDNKTEEGRRKNRRVTFTLVPK